MRVRKRDADQHLALSREKDSAQNLCLFAVNMKHCNEDENNKGEQMPHAHAMKRDVAICGLLLPLIRIHIRILTEDLLEVRCSPKRSRPHHFENDVAISRPLQQHNIDTAACLLRVEAISNMAFPNYCLPSNRTVRIQRIRCGKLLTSSAAHESESRK